MAYYKLYSSSQFESLEHFSHLLAQNLDRVIKSKIWNRMTIQCHYPSHNGLKMRIYTEKYPFPMKAIFTPRCTLRNKILQFRACKIYTSSRRSRCIHYEWLLQILPCGTFPLHGECYRTMLSDFLFPKVEENFVDKVWLQEDFATCHTTK